MSALRVWRCHQLLEHAPHIWSTRDGLISPENAQNYDNRDLRFCRGLTEEREVKPILEDRNPGDPRPICGMCGTWVCDSCGDFSRPRASRHPDVTQICSKCGSDYGVFLAARHRDSNLHEKE